MRQFITGLVGLVGLVAAQSSSQSDASVSSNTVSSSSTSVAASTSNSASSAGSTSSFAVSSTATSSSAVSSSISSTSSSASVPSAASNANAITVALDGSAQYTAINQAVAAAQNSAIPSVVVQPGVYSETVLIQGTQAVTIVGPTASSYAGNQVVISAAAPTGVVSFNTQRSNGIVLRNINITNTISTATAKAPAFNAYGMNMLIDTCALVSGGVAVYQANLGTTLIANSYIEGPDKLFYAYVTAYVYNSVIVPTAPSASIGYLQGYQTGGVWYNSSLIVDSSSIQQKPGSSASYVYLAQPNQNATVAVYRGTNMGNLIAPNAVRSTACATLYTLYGEFANTGPGAMSASNQASRTSSCDQALTANQMPSFSVDQVFGRAFPGFSSYDTTWIPSGLLSAIKSSDAAQVASNPSTPVSSSSSASSSLSASSVISSSSGSSSASATSGSVSSSGSSSLLSSSTVDATNSTSSSVSVSGTGVTSTSSASATLSSSSSASLASSTTNSTAMSVVTVAPTSAQFSDVNAAVAYAQNSGIATVSVLAGLYSGVTILGTQTVTIAGPTATAVSDNQVVITSGSSAGSVSLGTNNGRGLTLRNLNLTNSAASAGLGPAVSARGINVGIYTCALISSAQGVFTSSYGVTVIANSYLQGTDKIFYNYPTVYVYGSTISPTLSGSSIFYGKGATIAGTNYNATLVVDSSSVQGSGSNVYLGTPNGAAGMINLVYRNTALGSLIAPGGVYSSACSAPGSMFGEFQNNGPGAYANNAAARGAASCDFQLSADQVSSYSIKNIFANAFSGYASTDLSWVDSSVLSAIQSSDDAQLSSATISSATVTPSANATSSGINTASTTCPTPTPSATLVVSLNGTACSYGNISAAISALPNDNQPYTIQIQPGTYQEQISITRNGKVTLVGQSSNPSDYSQNTVKVQFANGQLTSAGKDEQTPTLNVKKVGSIPDFAVYNIDFINTYPQTPNTAALAADYYGSNFAAYGCSFIGFQDTLLTNKGVQVFANSYIEGSIDYIWGFATTYFYRSVIASNTVGGFVNAQARVAGTVSGNVFDQCKITYKQSTYGSTFGMTYLGRPYSSYSTVVYKNSWIDKHINPAGWTIWSTGSPQTSNVIFGEYNNTGPGSWQVGSPRATFATNMTADQVAPYSLSSWIGDTSFIDQTAWNFPAPFTIDANTTTPTTPTGTTGATATASINAHPDSGTVPPQFAVTVSVNGEMNGSYSNITAALASLPNDNTNQTVFIYPGSYNEQLPSINRPGAVRLIGSTDGNPGQSYKDNKVTITFSRGLSVSPLPTGHNDAETAVVSTASSRISFYNINIVNTDNLDGSQTSYVTLAASIYGQDIGFYACSFNGWQDTLLNGATAGYQYYESCYIGGAIDFIWGYSKAYFKGCTIGAKRASSAMTAQSRASSSAIGGYIFDQCLFTAAPDATVDLTNKVFLGRPYSAYALVVVKNSYIDKQVSPSGWKVWSATDPRTGFITFAEYNNTGPSNWENNVAARQAFQYATLLTSDTYSLQSTMDNTEWIDMTYWNSISTPQPAVVVPVPGNTTVTGNSAYNGTTPPQGALIVSQTPIDGQTVYPTIQQALDAAPTSSKTNATIFIYPGTYNEKLIVNKSGTTIFMGYSDNTGDYNSNKVTIQQSFGVDTQGTGSDVDAATVYAKGNYFYAYNINFRNNNGTQQDIASLGFAVQSSKFAFMHGCQIYGNQDTLYISGSMFTFKSLIIGNIDFIFGSGSGYFLNSTIAPNEDGDSITAAKRATASTAAGFVFDQCSVVPAPGVNAAGWKNVSLGRPWNNFANVAYIGSYLDGMIGAAGWDQWSKSSPQTDGVSYGEYHNYGPGSSTCGRVSFSKQLSDTDVVPYQLHNFFLSTSWIDFSVVDVQPFSVGQGTAPACATATASSSTVSSTSSSSISSSSISLVTVYTTQTYTDKEIATISVTSPVTSTTTQVIAGTDGPTNTPSPMFKTSVVKATSVVTSTVTAPDSTITLKSTQTVVSTQTAQGKAVTTTVTAISYATSTVVPKVVTVKSTTTVFTLSTITPKPKTVTDTQGELQTSYVTITPKAATVSSTISLSGALVVKTQQAKAHTVTSLITSTQTSTKKTTVTCAPTPAARFFRRGLEARAAGTTTLTINATVTSFTKTSFVTLPGSTIFATVTSTSSGRPATTLKPATSTVLSTSFANSVALVTQPGNTATITDIATKTSNTVYTQPASTVTQTVQSTSLSVITEAGTTTTSYKIVSSTSYTTLPVPTSTVVVNANSVTTLKTTLPASTTTVFKTVSGKATTSYVTAQPADVTKTATVKSVSTVYSTVTKSKAGATACA